MNKKPQGISHMPHPADPFVQHVLASALAALEKRGGLEYIAQREGVTADELSSLTSLDKRLLAEVLTYVAVNAPSLILRDGETFRAGPDLRDPLFRNGLYFFLAYEPVLVSLEQMLSGETKYGDGVERRGPYLSKSSAIHNAPAYETVVRTLRESEWNGLVDLGCGRGDFLAIAWKSFSSKKMLGVEIDPHVVRMADGSGPFQVIEGDARDPAAWKGRMKDMDLSRLVLVGITLWHEFLAGGEEKAIGVLNAYQEAFPGSLLIIVEYNAYSAEELMRLPTRMRGVSSLYQFVHPLTGQGDPLPVEDWLALFERAGLSVEKAVPAGHNLTVYAVRLDSGGSARGGGI